MLARNRDCSVSDWINLRHSVLPFSSLYGLLKLQTCELGINGVWLRVGGEWDWPSCSHSGQTTNNKKRRPVGWARINRQSFAVAHEVESEVRRRQGADPSALREAARQACEIMMARGAKVASGLGASGAGPLPCAKVGDIANGPVTEISSGFE